MIPLKLFSAFVSALGTSPSFSFIEAIRSLSAFEVYRCCLFLKIHEVLGLKSWEWMIHPTCHESRYIDNVNDIARHLKLWPVIQMNDVVQHQRHSYIDPIDVRYIVWSIKSIWNSNQSNLRKSQLHSFYQREDGFNHEIAQIHCKTEPEETTQSVLGNGAISGYKHRHSEQLRSSEIGTF